MFDFPIKEANIWTSIYCLFFYLCILIKNYNTGILHPYTRPLSKHKKNISLFFICLFIITHCMKGDFFHFMTYVHEYDFSPNAYNYGEPIYVEIGKLVNRNYFLFRCIVWGSAYIAFCWASRRLKIPVYYSAIYLFTAYCITFSYARVTAAMAIYILGFSFICEPPKKKRFIGILWGIILILCSTVFHNSTIIMVLMTFIILIPLKKWIIIISIILIPYLAALFKDYFYLIIMAENTDETLSNKIITYSVKDTEQGISGLIINASQYISFYIPFVLSAYWIIVKNKINKIPISIKLLFKLSFGFVFVAIIFLLWGETFKTFYYRILFMTMLPLVLIITKSYKEGIISYKHYLLCVWSGIIYQILQYTYSIYVVLVS